MTGKTMTNEIRKAGVPLWFIEENGLQDWLDDLAEAENAQVFDDQRDIIIANLRAIARFAERCEKEVRRFTY